jgi:Putative peptidoglycan binding domain
MQFSPKMVAKLPTLFAITIFITGFLLSTSVPVEGNGKKTRRVAAGSGNKKGRSSLSSRRSSRGKTARRGKRSRYQTQPEPLPIAAYQATPTYPDSIEVIEYGSSDSAAVKRLLNMPKTNTDSNLDSTDPAAPPKRVNVKMDTSRVLEIQQALANKGFYRSEMTGVYDESTVDAMRRFQLKENISVTGYPTAHALRRLGLAKW